MELPDFRYRSVVDELHANVEDIAAEIWPRLRAELPIYERVGYEALTRSVEMNVNTTASLLRSTADVVPRQYVEQLGFIIDDRVDTGVTFEQMVQAQNLVMEGILHRLIALGEEHGLPPAVTLTASRRLWHASHVMLQRGAVRMQKRMIDAAVREQDQRNELVRGLISGKLRGAELESKAIAQELALEGRYQAVTAKPGRTSDIESLLTSLQTRSMTEGITGLVTVQGSNYVGLVSEAHGRKLRASSGDNSFVALGPTVLLADLPLSFHAARSVLKWMLRRGRTGVMSKSDAGWRLLADADADVSSQLHATYLEPLTRDLALGPLLHDSLEAYLTYNRSIANAAAALVIHPNTLRYRLRRYVELSGVDLGSTEAIVGLALALEATRGVVVENKDAEDSLPF